MKFDKEVFAATIRAERNRLGMNQGDLAKKVGVSRDAIHKYEDGVQIPGADNAVALAEALHITPNELLGWDVQ